MTTTTPELAGLQPPPAPPAPPWDAMFLSRDTQEAMERLQVAPATSAQARPSHQLPEGRFEALPRIAQIAMAGEGLQVAVAALEIGGAIWVCRPFAGQGTGWTRLPGLPVAQEGR